MQYMNAYSNPYVTERLLSSGEVTYDIGGLGELSVLTPSGEEVFLSAEDEKDIAKAALEDQLMMEFVAPGKRKEAIITAGIGAIGNALGFALAGLVVGWFLGQKGRRDTGLER